MAGVDELRRAFPVLERVAYLNAGTDGPVPRASVDAARAELDREAERGRVAAHFDRRTELQDRLRAGYAERLAADPRDVALTSSTTDGISRVLGAMRWEAGDEVVTSDVEHPGLLGPLSALARRGVEIREVPLAELPGGTGPRTKLIAASHVSWLAGIEAPDLSSSDVPVLLDGAQGVGALAVDVQALGCAAYAGSGQKWLCGPDGLGMLWTSPGFRAQLDPAAPGYTNLIDPAAGAQARLHEDARCFDAPALTPAAVAAGVAALEVLDAAGWDAVLDHAHGLAEDLATRLRDSGREVAARSRTTLVSWRAEDPEGDRDRLAAQDIVVRSFTGHPWIRASIGGWSSEDDLDRLIAAITP